MRTFLLLLVSLGVITPAFAARHTEVEYGTAAGESLKLDAYVPDGAGPHPVVILVHGGGWTGGDKNGGPRKGYMMPMHAPLEQAGFAWFSINYRLAPKHPYPACIDDVETAIRWVKAHAKEYRIDSNRIALSGESAGGHLVQLAAVRATDATRVAALVPFYGRCDMTLPIAAGTPLTRNFAALTGRSNYDAEAQKILRDASPLQQIKRGLPPCLLVHGTADASVPYQQSVQFEAKLREVGVPCEFITVKDGVHGMLSWDPASYQPQVVAWLKKTLGDGAKTARH